MSRHEIEIEGLGPEWEAVGVNAGQHVLDHDGSDVKYVGAVLKIRRKVRKYDWGKTHSGTLVTRVDQDGYWTCGISFALGKQACIADLWQPNIHGKCPVDGEACWVRVRYMSGDVSEAAAHIIDWSLGVNEGTVTAWQFIRLADGYEW